MNDPAVPSEVGAPHDWCPECDGPGECQPGTCCGRPYPALEEAELWLRGLTRGASHPHTARALVSLLAEYDRRDAELARCRKVVQAATALVEDAQEHGGAVSNHLLVALAAEVAALPDDEGS